jgi:serine/threonine protein kinase
MQSLDLFDDRDFDPSMVLDHRYQIVASLGQGGMGRVYKAFHVLLDTPVALKELSTVPHATSEEREQAIRRFCREARLLTGLRHPNIPRGLDYFTEGASCYLVMDYIEGVTLAERLDRGNTPGAGAPLALSEALDYASQLCTVLIYLHSQQPAVVFGDLKPANVILTPDGRTVLVDFGIARASVSGSDTPFWEHGLADSEIADAESDTQLLGTAGYAAPEQYEPGWRADPRSDIFALGVLLREMVTGQAPPPFPFGFQPVRAMNPELPGALEELIERALCFHPEERFQSAGQMYQMLRLVAQEVAFQECQTAEMILPLGLEVSQAIVPPSVRRLRAHLIHLRRAMLASAGAIGVMAIIALSLLFFGLSNGTQGIASNALNHPLAVAPANTATATPTATAAQHLKPNAVPKPTPTASPAPSPAPTPVKKPTPTPTSTPSASTWNTRASPDGQTAHTLSARHEMAGNWLVWKASLDRNLLKLRIGTVCAAHGSSDNATLNVGCASVSEEWMAPSDQPGNVTGTCAFKCFSFQGQRLLVGGSLCAQAYGWP